MVFKLRFLRAGLVLAALMVFAAGCINQKASGEILIGAVWPFESNSSLFGEGADLAVKQINESGGVNGRMIRLVKVDDEASVVKGMSIAESFAESGEVMAVIGHRSSPVSIPTSKIYEDAGIIMLSSGSTAPDLTQKGYRYVFRNIPDVGAITRQLTLHAAANGHKRMVIYYTEDSYGISLANAFEDHARESGIAIVDRASYYGDVKGLARLHQKWKALDFDGIFVAQAMPEGAQFIADAGKVGIDVPFLGTNAMDSPLLAQIGGTSAEGTVVGTVFNPGDTSPETKKFVEDFQWVYGKEPLQYSALGYDAVRILAEAARQSGSADPAAVAEKLRSFKDWPGAAGLHSHNSNGDEIGAIVVKKILRNGKLEVIE